MDFKTTEEAADLGGLVRTITESVCTPERQRELDGLEQRFDANLWAKLIEADVLSAAAGVGGRWRFGRARAGGRADRAGPPSGCRAVP